MLVKQCSTRGQCATYVKCDHVGSKFDSLREAYIVPGMLINEAYSAQGNNTLKILTSSQRQSRCFKHLYMIGCFEYRAVGVP